MNQTSPQEVFFVCVCGIKPSTSVRIVVLKTGPDWPVRPIQLGTSLVWENPKTGQNRVKQRTGGKKGFAPSRFLKPWLE